MDALSNHHRSHQPTPQEKKQTHNLAADYIRLKFEEMKMQAEAEKEKKQNK